MYDTLEVGDLIVRKQPFASADTIEVPLLADVVWDGVLGLAYPAEDLAKEVSTLPISIYVLCFIMSFPRE
jgi:hypothetical protein